MSDGAISIGEANDQEFATAIDPGDDPTGQPRNRFVDRAIAQHAREIGDNDVGEGAPRQ